MEEEKLKKIIKLQLAIKYATSNPELSKRILSMLNPPVVTKMEKDESRFTIEESEHYQTIFTKRDRLKYIS